MNQDNTDRLMGDTNMDPHAYHRNLPSHYMDPADGIPHVTKYAEKKARAAIKLLKDIHLTENLFLENDQDCDMDEDEENSFSNETLASITKKCGRVAAQLNTLVSLKHTGITEEELCDMILHVLRLLTATVSISEVSLDTSPVEESEAGSASNEIEIGGSSSRHVVLRFENVGHIITYEPSGEETIRYAGNGGQEGQESAENKPDTSCNIEKRLSESFALPSPARESLLSIANMLLSKKAPLRSASNMAIFLPDGEVRMSLIIDWKALLRMLLRTAPYLDEDKAGEAPSVSSSRQGAVLKRTVNLIRHCRRHFEQGVRPGAKKITDQTAVEVWNMVKTDLLHRTHSNACFRAIIILYLFQPSCCSSDYYANVMPSWLESWNSIDRSQEFDFLWLVMFCRARKYVHLDAYDWGPIRRRLLTLCGCWLQIPVGGSTGDKSFPRTASPRWRNFPPRLKAFVGGGSSYQEGMDFVGKISKLLVYCIGKSDSPSSIISDGGGIEETSDPIDGSPSISDGTEEMIRFFTFVAPYFNPSNIGNWSYPLGAFLHYFSYELCHRVGLDGGLRSLMESHPLVARKLCEREALFTTLSIPGHELVAILDALLPLCQQGLYSKNGHVGRAAETALLYLVQIDPIHICPPCLDFATRALDISSVNLSHQAPAALSALSRLIQPALRRNPAVLLTRLPSILSLSLAGIDSNDQNKTIRSLILYRSICYWVPVGSNLIAQRRGPENTESSAGVTKDGTIQFGDNHYKHLSDITSSKKYEEALNRLPEDSLLYQRDEYFGGGSLNLHELLEETGLTMCDWSLSFLDRIYMLFRAAGEQEKAQHARNFSRVLKDCLEQFFSSMDSETFQLAVRSVSQFLSEETLVFAAKDVSALCQAICCARNSEDGRSSSPGLDALVPIITDDLRHQSQETALYRIRCLSGAVRNAGHSVLDHRESISQALEYALSITDNKHLFKAGCKLLRHTLSSQCETYPLMPDCTPRMAASEGDVKENVIGKSAQLRDDPILWHIPNGKQIDFTYHLIEKHGLGGIHDLGKASVEKTDMDTDSDASIEIIETPGTEKEAGIKSDIPYTVDLPQWRRALRILRYTIRGCAGILLDADDEKIFSHLPPSDPIKQGAGVDLSAKPSFASFNDDCDNDLVPHEKAVTYLLQSSTLDTQRALFGMRGRLCSMISSLASLIARETADCHTYTGNSPDENAGSDSDSNEMFAKSLSIDRKVCEEVTELSSLLLTRRGSSCRCQETKGIWKAQKQMLTDFVLASQAETVASTLQRVSLYSVAENNVYKDGEGGGKCISRRLLAIRLNLFHQGVQRNASYEIPRRMRRKSRNDSGLIRSSLFSLDTTLPQLLSALSISSNTHALALDGYEGIIDGLFSLSCHPNVQVRSAATIIDYALTRFGWMARSRVSRILSALSLTDEEMKGKFGIPSCSQLSRQLDVQGKRTRLAEVLKGVCSLTVVPRTVKEILGNEATRLSFVKTFCGTQKLIAILPPEEMQKMILYFHSIFSQFRNRFFSLPRITKDQQRDHKSCIKFLLDILVVQESTLEEKDGQGDVADNGTAEASSMHWRNRLIVGWFITNYIDTEDLLMDDQALVDRLWKSCFHLIRNEVGQPLQRVAVGLFGRLVTLTQNVIRQSNTQSGIGSVSAFVPNFSSLIENLKDKSFCRALGTALVFDHKEDTSVGGGHNAQWSTGVEDILKDALSNVAPRTLFPFQRAGRSSSTLILQHAQLVNSMLLSIGRENASIATEHFLAFAKEMAATPPSEDQRNEQCTAAEIFAGVCRTMMELEVDSHARAESWTNSMIPFLDEVIPKTPTGQIGIYYDSLRYAIHQFPSGHYLPLTKWIIEKVVSTLWQPDIGLDEEVSQEVVESAAGTSLGVSATDGFAYQSKWLFLATAILVELNDETEEAKKDPWYKNALTDRNDTGSKLEERKGPEDSQDESWVLVSEHLLPRLLNAVGHPYEKCRDHISGCLYRICCCHRKFRSRSIILESPADLLHDPSRTIVEKFCSTSVSQTLSFKDRHNALITARKFMAYCVHLGDYKHEFSECIIPLIPLSFEALKATIDGPNEKEEDSKNVVNAASRALEAEVVKGFRYSLSEISSHCLITYGKEDDMSRILETVKNASKHEHWQIRQASAHYLRCFQGCHKFLFGKELTELTTVIVAALLADERREVSSAAMAALTGILAATPLNDVIKLVDKYVIIAKKSAIKKKKKIADPSVEPTQEEIERLSRKEKFRAKNQQTSVFFLCAAVLAQPYDTPLHVPVALAALSKHSYERSAPLSVREAVKLCCSEFKRTHMSDNWDVHRKQFSQEQLEALDDVVSTPHYYA